MKRTVVTVLAGLWYPLVVWASGADLTERGPALSFSLVVSPFLALFAYFCPMWEQKHD